MPSDEKLLACIEKGLKIRIFGKENYKNLDGGKKPRKNEEKW